MRALPMNDVEFVYFGNLFPHEPQFKCGKFHALALAPKFERDIQHDATKPLPFPNDSIQGFQSQDVFEHIKRESIVAILDEVYRCLQPGGLFRLSLPDYNSPLLRDRSIYNEQGEIICDLAMGGRVACSSNGKVEVKFSEDGGAHVWFPTYHKVIELIIQSQLRRCSGIAFWHAWLDRTSFICDTFDAGIMPVTRAPPQDMRAQGKPISIVVDFIK